MGYVSHKGDRGHDSAEPVSSEGEGASTASPSLRSPACNLQAGEPRKGSGSLLEEQRGRGGHRVTPGSTLPHCQAIWSQPAPRWGGCKVGDGGPLSWLHITRQTEILHFQAVENVKFPCSRLESHQHRVGTLVILADQTSDWQLGMSLINFLKKKLK